MKKEKDDSKKSDLCDEEKWEKKFEKDFGEKLEKKFENWGKCDKWHNRSGGFVGGWFYCLGFLGAAVYYIQYANGFWMGVLGVLKALVWPAMLIFEVFVRLGM